MLGREGIDFIDIHKLPLSVQVRVMAAYQGVDLTVFADYLGVSPKTTKDIASMKNTCSTHFTQKFCEYFGYETAEMYKKQLEHNSHFNRQ